MPALVVRTADELERLHAAGRQTARRAARESPLMRVIFGLFVARGGPLAEAEIAAASGRSGIELERALAALDGDDLIRVGAGGVDVAYPFSTTATAFVVELADGRERYACCAMDALGIAPMLGQGIVVRSRCHESGAPLRFRVGPDGAAADARGMMVWFGEWGDERARVMDGL